MHVANTEQTDSDIARLVQGGDIDSFGTLMERYEEKLLRYGRRFLARTEDCEDIVQDVFLAAYQNIQSYQPSLPFSPWLYRIAHNAYVNALRKSGRIHHTDDLDTLIGHHEYEDPAQKERDEAEIRLLLERGLSELPPHYREVLILYYYDDMAYKDIAEVLRVPIGTVGIRVKRAKKALRLHIKDHL